MSVISKTEKVTEHAFGNCGQVFGKYDDNDNHDDDDDDDTDDSDDFDGGVNYDNSEYHNTDD